MGDVREVRGELVRAGKVAVVLPVRVAEPPQLVDDLVEPLALDELHRVEGRLAIAADLEDRHDVGVVHPRRGLGLAAEPLQRLAVADRVSWQDLQRHAAAERDLLGLVDHAHPAPADLAEDPVIADLAEPRGRGRRRRGRLAPRVAVGLLDLGQGREHLPDLVGHLGQAVDVLLQARPLAAAVALGELLGELVEPPVVAGTGCQRHGLSPLRSHQVRRSGHGFDRP